MALAAFDTYAAAKALREAGFDERQAEAVVETAARAAGAGHSELATKADLKDFATRGDLAAGLARLEARIYLAFLAFALANAALTVAIIKLLL